MRFNLAQLDTSRWLRTLINPVITGKLYGQVEISYRNTREFAGIGW